MGIRIKEISEKRPKYFRENKKYRRADNAKFISNYVENNGFNLNFKFLSRRRHRGAVLKLIGGLVGRFSGNHRMTDF